MACHSAAGWMLRGICDAAARCRTLARVGTADHRHADVSSASHNERVVHRPAAHRDSDTPRLHFTAAHRLRVQFYLIPKHSPGDVPQQPDLIRLQPLQLLHVHIRSAKRALRLHSAWSALVDRALVRETSTRHAYQHCDRALRRCLLAFCVGHIDQTFS